MYGAVETEAINEGLNIIKVRRNLTNNTIIIGFIWDDDAYEVVVPSKGVQTMEDAYRIILAYTRKIREN